MPDTTTNHIAPGENDDPVVHTGAEQGIDMLAWRYRSSLVRYFLLHLGSLEDAEDLAQEVFVRFAQQKSAQPIVNFEAFLFRIAANLLRDRFRRNKTHHVQAHFPIDECTSEQLGEAPSGERVYEEQEKLHAFLQALEELPPKCRAVFLLQRYEGMSYSAVAQHLGISVSAVEKHMMKALLHFDARLDRT
jgi:RNA polymerase sigma-70 factor (ECF subfamily)